MKVIDNIKSLTYREWIIAIALGAAVGLVSGCSRYFLKVDTPTPLVDLGYPAKTTLAETGMYQDEFARWYNSQQDTWNAREDAGEQKALFIDGIVGSVVSPENLASWGFNPYGGAGAAFISLATMLAGRKGKEASYNAGLEKGKELANG